MRVGNSVFLMHLFTDYENNILGYFFARESQLTNKTFCNDRLNNAGMLI